MIDADILYKKMHSEIPYIPFPVALNVVDIAVVCKTMVLLGNKPNVKEMQFVGGFVNPAESHEEAGRRELKEETGLYIDNLSFFKYVGSFFIDDERFKNSCHKITSVFFVVEIPEKLEIKASDDLEKLQWVSMQELSENCETMLVKKHHKLFDALNTYLLWI